MKTLMKSRSNPLDENAVVAYLKEGPDNRVSGTSVAGEGPGYVGGSSGVGWGGGLVGGLLEGGEDGEVAEQAEGEHVGLFLGLDLAHEAEGQLHVHLLAGEKVGGQQAAFTHSLVSPQGHGQRERGFLRGGYLRELRNVQAENDVVTVHSGIS